MDFENDQIIELAMLTYVDGKKVDEYDEFIRYNQPLPSKITAITGITDKMLEEKGLSEKEVATNLKEVLDEGNILMIAHNAQFDLLFIYYMLKRYFPDDVWDLLKKNDWLDTLTVYKDLRKYPHKLSDAVKEYELEEVNFHRAIDDTKALSAVYEKMKSERKNLKQYKNVFGYNKKYGVSGFRFEFITYGEQKFHNCKVSDDEILPNVINNKK